jgi:hypothetical protein
VSIEVESAYDQFPLYEGDGCSIPSSVFANLSDPLPDLPESPLPTLLPVLAAIAVSVVIRLRRRTRA